MRGDSDLEKANEQDEQYKRDKRVKEMAKAKEKTEVWKSKGGKK